jgi:hypothetical protein
MTAGKLRYEGQANPEAGFGANQWAKEKLALGGEFA